MTRILHRIAERRCLTPAEWPETDRRLWQAALVAGDLLEDGGARAGYSAITNAKVEKGYGRWLAWLAVRGMLDDKPPAQRIMRQRVRNYIDELKTFNATSTLMSRLQELHDAAKVMAPNADWRWIRRIEAQVRSRHVPARSKRERMVSAADLLALGCTLMADASALTTARRRAMQFRDGLIIALLAVRPLRLRNLAALEIGRTVVRRGTFWWIDVPSAETKTRQPIEIPWPESLASALEIYLNQHRPLLSRLRNRWTREVGNALWVSTNGSPMTKIALYDTIVGRTGTAFGRPINPHLFRDCAATSIAIEDPEHVRIASQILGHRSAATTERYYNQAQTIDAARRYQDFLVALRDGRLDRNCPS